MCVTKKQKIWKSLFSTLKGPTKICKICFKEIENSDFFFLGKRDIQLCESCRRKFEPKYIKFKVLNYNALALYIYDETIKTYLFQLKGCFDIELKDSFFEMYSRELSIMYSGYTIIPIPSSKNDDLRRGFNHVYVLFSSLKLPIKNLLEKTDDYKQSDQKKTDRKNIKNHLRLKDKIDLSKNMILLVDDVYTTGSTMKAAVKLVETLHPKDIKILVLSKTKFDDSLGQTN